MDSFEYRKIINDMADKENKGGNTMIWLFTIISAIAMGLLRAVIFVDFWEWFIMPLGAPAIEFWLGYGLLMVVGFTTYKYEKPDNEDALKTAWSQLLTAVIYTLISWGFGALVHSFIV